MLKICVAALLATPLAIAVMAASGPLLRESLQLPLSAFLADATLSLGFVLRPLDVMGVSNATAEEDLAVDATDPVTLAFVNDETVGEPLLIAPDQPLTLQWSRAVTSFGYLVDEVPGRWIGEPNHTIRLPVHSVPGRTIEVTVTEATAFDGGSMLAPQLIELVSPPLMQIVATWPENGATSISVTGDPTIRFSEPIALEDQAVAAAAIAFDPPVDGRFQWLSQDRVRFLPADSLPSFTDVTVTVQGGSNSVRSQSGSILGETFSLTFQTGRLKVIDVSLGQQVLTLYEDDEPLWNTLVATGVRGADTPIGTYRVAGKVPAARFRGVNVDGSRYDIPNVHWVMPFYGDYTIHGAYWRSVFGRPGSNGCISMSDANAKVVYDWADEGTLVVIRR